MTKPIIIILIMVTVLATVSGLGSTALASPEMPRQKEGMPGQEWSKGHMMSGNDPPPIGVPMEMIARGSGFAFQDGESHLLKVNIVRLSPLDPGQVIGLLTSNKSIEEIREAIVAKEEETVYRGSMKLDSSIYPLTNIIVESSADRLTQIEADVAAPGPFDAAKTEPLGHFNLTLSSVEGGEVGKGLLKIESLQHKGSYDLLLDVARHPRPAQRDG